MYLKEFVIHRSSWEIFVIIKITEKNILLITEKTRFNKTENQDKLRTFKNTRNYKWRCIANAVLRRSLPLIDIC